MPSAVPPSGQPADRSPPGVPPSASGPMPDRRNALLRRRVALGPAWLSEPPPMPNAPRSAREGWAEPGPRPLEHYPPRPMLPPEPDPPDAARRKGATGGGGLVWWLLGVASGFLASRIL